MLHPILALTLPPLLTIALYAGVAIVGIIVLYVVMRIVGFKYHNVDQGQALIRNGLGGTSVSFSGMTVWPIIHRLEYMDITVKRVEIDRRGATGLICKDNLRADIKVAFFVRVEKESENVKRVAQSLGCVRASDEQALIDLFDAKFSDALKAAGRQFDFEELLNSREAFRQKVKESIGTDLNGYVLDDASIDHLEQTKVDLLDPDNILDSEGIKKITERTAIQKIRANEINRDREKTITQKDIETREAVLELNRQLSETEEKQKREVASIKAREESTTLQVQQEERLKGEKARILTEEEVQVAEENKNRQILIAQRNKERADAIEQQRVQKDRDLEATEREKVVALASIERDKIVETERKSIQEVIRQRVMVERTVVEEQQRMKDTEAFAGAERERKVKMVDAEAAAEQQLVKEIKAAEAAKKAAELSAEQEFYKEVKLAEARKKAAELDAEQKIVSARAEQLAAVELAEGKKKLAAGITAEQAAPGLAEVNIMEAKSAALEKQGTAEARVLDLKFKAEADGITRKAEAMKLLHEAGKEHEEFKLELATQKDIALARIAVQKDIASSQALVVGEALKNTRVDIVGGETEFFDRIVGSITAGKALDRMVDNSRTLTTVRNTFFKGDADTFRQEVRKLVDSFGFSPEELKNLSITAALTQMAADSEEAPLKSLVKKLQRFAKGAGLGAQKLDQFLADLDESKVSRK
ncbi:MAG: SPFH domain-containing protein [Verrucomicrobiae bacterium]|nr:SPFH domain-containing protein [Verrucomicrobiae bacterium]